MHLHVRCLARFAQAPEAWRCLAALPKNAAAVLLDDAGGLQMLAWNPDRRVHGAVRPGELSHGERRWPLADVDVGHRLETACEDEVWEHEAGLPELGPGWVGWCSFECGHAYEAFPWNPPYPDSWPDYHFGRYRKALVWLPDGEALLLHAGLSDEGEAQEQQRAQEEAEQLMAQAGQVQLAPMPLALSPTIPAATFQRRVRRLREWIGEGELFQANLSHVLEASFQGDPRLLYGSRRAQQPTAMGAYWQDGRGRALLSQSPELFLSVHGNQLTTRPIKGTAPRGKSAAEDEQHAEALHHDEKEVAELTMIVDMARNDLGRIADTGSVQVLTAGEVESFPTLFHRTADVRARWDPRQGMAALFAATFPPASITGAPKVRALEAIASLEQRSRGPYCGSMFHYLPGPAPRARFSVLIRSATVGAGRLRLAVGAGIVWDSDPVREWEETLLKGRYLEGA